LAADAGWTINQPSATTAHRTTRRRRRQTRFTCMIASLTRGIVLRDK
jgi:hypothetical protein